MRIRLAYYEDWVQLFVDGNEYFGGHSIPTDIWLDLLKMSLNEDLYGYDEGESFNFNEYPEYFAYNSTPNTEKEAEELQEWLKENYVDWIIENV